MRHLIADLQLFQDSQDYQDFCRLNLLENGYTYPQYIVEKACREARAMGVACEEPQNPTVVEAMNFIAGLVVQGEASDREQLKGLTNFTLKQAALYLGMSESGLRKLVSRRAIQFSQARRGAAIKFRREWLDAYISEKEEAKPKKRKSRSAIVSDDHGLDPSLVG